jgi:hypothetical protein
MLVNGEYNALSEPVLHHPRRPVNQSDDCDLHATFRLIGLLSRWQSEGNADGHSSKLSIGRVLADPGSSPG